MRDAMCRYMYIFFSNCSHQTFVLLDCCSAADVRTVVNDYAVVRKAPKIHSRWEQKYSHPASELFPPEDVHRKPKPTTDAQNECEQSVRLCDTLKHVGVDDHVSRFRGCHPSLGVSDDFQNVAYDHPIGNAPTNDTHIRPRCRSDDSLTAGTSLPAHLQHPQEMKTARRSGYLGSKRRTSRETGSASASTAKSSVNSSFESSIFHLGRDGTEDVASHLQSRTIDKLETGRIHRKMSWAAQVKEELQAGFLPEQSPMLCEACAPFWPRVRELLGEEASVCSCRSVPEAKDGETGSSESAIDEGQDYSAIQPSPLFYSSRHVRSASEEGFSTYKSGLSNIKPNARVKHDRGASPEDGPSSSAIHEAVLLRSGPAILSGDKHTRFDAATKQSERSQGAARTSGIGRSKSSSRGESFTLSEQLLKGNNKASTSNTSQRTDNKLQSLISDNTLGELSVNDQGGARSSATESGPIEMTWAQRVRAGGSKGTIPRNPEQKLPSQDPLHNPSASGSLLPRSGFRWGLSKGSSVAPVSDSLQVTSPPANNRALPTVSSTSAQTSRSDGLKNSQSNRSLLRAADPFTATFSNSHKQGQATSESIRQTQTATDKTARINPHDEGSDETLRKSSQGLSRPTLDGIQAEENDGSEWHIVTRKNKVPQTARPSKATRRKTKSMKRLSQSAPTALAPIQKAASFLPTPKISPCFPPRSSFSPSSESMSTLLKPSYAAVASLRSPVISISSSTTSTADAPFISAPQSPEHSKPASDIPLGSPESSDNYFSATEDLEEKCHSPTRDLASEGHLGSWEAPAAMVLSQTDKVSTTSAQASREVYDKKTLAAENIGPGSPNSETIDTVLGWMGQDQSIRRHEHSPKHSLRSPTESLRATNRSDAPRRKPTKGLSYDSLGDESFTETRCKIVRGGSSNAQGNTAPSQDDGRGSESSDPSGGLMATEEIALAGAGGCKEGTTAISSHRNRSEDKPISSVRKKKSCLQEGHTPPTKSALPDMKGRSGAPEPIAFIRKSSKRSHKLKGTNHNSKSDASSKITATPSSPKTEESQQVSPLPLLASPPNVSASPRSQDRNSASTPSQNSTQDLSSEPQGRGRAGGRVTHEVATSLDMPREDSILRGEAPEFTPQTTPSKSRESTLQSPTSLTSHMPEGMARPLDQDYAAFALGYPPAPLQSLPGVRDKVKESILMPWMSRDFWLPKNTVARGHEMRCVLVGNDVHSEPREQTAIARDVSGLFGQIRRLKPCGFIKVEQAVEQIGTWCPRCNPDC